MDCLRNGGEPFMKLFCCDVCKYLFESIKEEIVQCPSFGDGRRMSPKQCGRT